MTATVEKGRAFFGCQIGIVWRSECRFLELWYVPEPLVMLVCSPEDVVLRAIFLHGRCKMQVFSFTKICVLNGFLSPEHVKRVYTRGQNFIPGTQSYASLLLVGSLE